MAGSLQVDKVSL